MPVPHTHACQIPSSTCGLPWWSSPGTGSHHGGPGFESRQNQFCVDGMDVFTDALLRLLNVCSYLFCSMWLTRQQAFSTSLKPKSLNSRPSSYPGYRGWNLNKVVVPLFVCSFHYQSKKSISIIKVSPKIGT